ncbi:MAG: nicotinate-nucleotide--dimethylbenzimidazole phosphoribosyltransferase [Chloroflexota bacterium]|nr:MAG: nicotinate-nucleotide--dimethylbenzimidazole phosphoribosyltransferase [Chloroflexota bacterium]
MSWATDIPALDRVATATARARQARLTKPAGSLGRLEELAITLAGITGDVIPRVMTPVAIIGAGDHGVTAEGVSAYPSAVTAQMALNFVAGGAAVSVLARQVGARVIVVDFGIATELPADAAILRRKIGFGTRNFANGPAMSYAEAVAAIEAGIGIVNDAIDDGADLIALGEMGIGNTTASSAIVAALLERPPAEVVGRGTGIDDAGLTRKIGAVESGLRVNRPDPHDPLDTLAKVGGFEIAGLVGVILGAARRRCPIVLDGFITTAAALVARRLAPPAAYCLVASHRSVEIGHTIILDALGLTPLLDLQLRLGEGSGALLATKIIVSACALHAEMATFDEAGVSGRLADDAG